MNDGDALINFIRQSVSGAQADRLNDLLQAARNAQNVQQWRDATAAFRREYRTMVHRELRKFIPVPILALPGVPELMRQLVDRALDQGEQAMVDAAKELSLGLASARLSVPPVLLPPPAAVGGLPALIGFQPPSGLSLSFGGAPVSGGGTLDYQRTPNPRLSGALGLKMSIAQVSALSILEEAPGGYSLLTLISARFAPGIQLGFGFAISGIGGLIGVNRAVDAAALEGQFRTGALVNALFGDNPIGNAASTLVTLNAVFRAHMGKHVFGPSLQLSWLKAGAFTLFNVDLGVFMQLPGPSGIYLIGSARAGIPLVFQLRLDVLGELDFARRVVSLHAVIVDSFMMGVFKLQGEAIFRMRYGDDPYVVLTVGGFFPGFNPAPAELPTHIRRIGMALDLPVALPVYLRAEGYLAVTPNTLQFGAHLEAGFDAGLFSAEGHFILDALFQFDPFRFDVRFSAGFHVKVAGASFAGVECSGTITGPGPVVIHARISYKTPFLLPNINWSDTFTIGRSAPRIEEMADLFARMRDEMTPANLRAENGDDPHVALRVQGAQSGGRALLAPLGDLVWTQRLAPLGLELQRLQNTPLAQPAGARVMVKSGAQNDPAAPRERFNLGMYRHLSDAERLNLNAQVEEHVAGVRHRYGMQSGASDAIPIGFDEYRRPALAPALNLLAKPMARALLDKVSDRSIRAEVTNLTPQVTTAREEWCAGGQRFDTQAAAHIAGQQAHSVARLTLDTVDVGDIYG